LRLTALHKWFLWGAEESFEKDEGLAFTFARKAASKGLLNLELALGVLCGGWDGRAE
jgi:hypothetical protein